MFADPAAPSMKERMEVLELEVTSLLDDLKAKQEELQETSFISLTEASQCAEIQDRVQTANKFRAQCAETIDASDEEKSQWHCMFAVAQLRFFWVLPWPRVPKDSHNL